jgi:hypothetical protein
MVARDRIGIVGLFGILGAIAAVLMVTEVRQFLGLPVAGQPAQDALDKPTALPDAMPPVPPPDGLQLAPTTGDRYLNPGDPNRVGRLEVAILVEDEPLPGNLEARIAEVLRERGADPILSLFKPAFTDDGHTRTLARADWSPLLESKVGERADVVVVVQNKSDVSADPEFEGVLTASLTLRFVCIHALRPGSCGSHQVTARGAGFSPDAAIEDAALKIWSDVQSFVAELRFLSGRGDVSEE